MNGLPKSTNFVAAGRKFEGYRVNIAFNLIRRSADNLSSDAYFLAATKSNHEDQIRSIS